MAISNNKASRLVFNTAIGNTFAVTVPNPLEGLQWATVEAVMDTIIERNIFLTTGGALVSKRDAKVVSTTTEDLFDPPQI